MHTVCTYIHFILGCMRTRVWPRAPVLLRCWYLHMYQRQNGFSLPVYMRIYMTDSGTDRCTAVSSTVQVSVVCHMCIVCTHIAAVFV